eukprot:9171050-Pyramimonas_sp.AAC.2
MLATTLGFWAHPCSSRRKARGTCVSVACVAGRSEYVTWRKSHQTARDFCSLPGEAPARACHGG